MKATDWRTQTISGLPSSTLISYLSVSLHRKSWERSLSPDMETKRQICLLPISDTRNPWGHLGWNFPSQGSSAKERVSLPLSSLAYHLDCWNSCYLTFSQPLFCQYLFTVAGIKLCNAFPVSLVSVCPTPNPCHSSALPATFTLACSLNPFRSAIPICPLL